MTPSPTVELTRRPPSVWITQIFLILIGIVGVLLTLVNFVLAITMSQRPILVIGNIIFSLILLIVPLSSFLGFWGLLKRKTYGRWAGVAWLSLILIFSILGNIFRPTGPMKYAEYENSVELISGMLTILVIYGLFALLIYRLARGKAANAFFAIPVDKAMMPPPPPRFGYRDSNR
jgi:hypothetical protein